MMDQFGAVLLAYTVAAGVITCRWLLGGPGPKHPLLRGVRDIFNALEGRPLPTPGNARIWWRRRRTR